MQGIHREKSKRWPWLQGRWVCMPGVLAYNPLHATFSFWQCRSSSSSIYPLHTYVQAGVRIKVYVHSLTMQLSQSCGWIKRITNILCWTVWMLSTHKGTQNSTQDSGYRLVTMHRWKKYTTCANCWRSGETRDQNIGASWSGMQHMLFAHGHDT